MDGTPYHGPSNGPTLTWSGDYALRTGECFRVTVRWTELGSPALTQVCVAGNSWRVPQELYARADQQTDRTYEWSVAVARVQTAADGQTAYVALGPESLVWSFTWN